MHYCLRSRKDRNREFAIGMTQMTISGTMIMVSNSVLTGIGQDATTGSSKASRPVIIG